MIGLNRKGFLVSFANNLSSFVSNSPSHIQFHSLMYEHNSVKLGLQTHYEGRLI